MAAARGLRPRRHARRLARRPARVREPRARARSGSRRARATEVRGFVGEGARMLLARAVAPRDELARAGPRRLARRTTRRTASTGRALPRHRGAPRRRGARRSRCTPTSRARWRGRSSPASGSSRGSRPWSAATRRRASRTRPGLLEIMARVGAAPGETVFVGDSRARRRDRAGGGRRDGRGDLGALLARRARRGGRDGVRGDRGGPRALGRVTGRRHAAAGRKLARPAVARATPGP